MPRRTSSPVLSSRVSMRLPLTKLPLRLFRSTSTKPSACGRCARGRTRPWGRRSRCRCCGGGPACRCRGSAGTTSRRPSVTSTSRLTVTLLAFARYCTALGVTISLVSSSDLAAARRRTGTPPRRRRGGRGAGLPSGTCSSGRRSAPPAGDRRLRRSAAAARRPRTWPSPGGGGSAASAARRGCPPAGRSRSGCAGRRPGRRPSIPPGVRVTLCLTRSGLATASTDHVQVGEDLGQPARARRCGARPP